MAEQYIEDVKDDMEFEALDTIRELHDYAKSKDIEPDFVLECFVKSFHKYLDVADFDKVYSEFCDKELKKNMRK